MQLHVHRTHIYFYLVVIIFVTVKSRLFFSFYFFDWHRKSADETGHRPYGIPKFYQIEEFISCEQFNAAKREIKMNEEETEWNETGSFSKLLYGNENEKCFTIIRILL